MVHLVFRKSCLQMSAKSVCVCGGEAIYIETHLDKKDRKKPVLSLYL